MLNDKYPPEGSAISMTESSEGIRYSWPAGTGWKIGNIGATVFLLFWLVGWGFGEVFAISRLLDPETPTGGSLFMIVWLGGWTVGGIFCLSMVYLNLRPLRPAVLLLGRSELTYETGTCRPEMSGNRRHTNVKSVFQGTQNRISRIPSSECINLSLERVGERLRLSVDHDSRRVEIGKSLGEPDKEWLHGLLERVVRAS